jgi:uncharacterized protein involved in exopolysaccharide biosynthesis
LRPASAEPPSERLRTFAADAGEPESIFGGSGLRLRQGWRWLLGLAVAGLLVGVIAALVLPKQYEASALVMVTPPRREAQAAPPLTRFRLLAESNALASQIVTDFNLSDPRFGLSAQRFRERTLAVDEVRGTNLLRIRVRLGDPAVATSVCNSLATKLIDLQRQLDLGSAVIMADSLKDQLTQAEHKLRTAEDRFEGYNAKAQVELTQEDANARLTQRGALVALLVDIETDKARLRAAEAEIKNYEPILAAPRLVGAEQALGHQRANANADSTRRELDASAERAERQDEGRLTARADDGTQATTRVRGSDSTAPDPNDRDARSRRDPALSTPADQSGLVDTSNPLVNPVYSTLQYEIATTRTKLAGLERRRRELVDVLKIDGAELGQITELHQKQLEAARRRTDVDIARRIHGELSMQYEEARLGAVTSATTLQLVDKAVAPDTPVWPKLPMFGALGLLLGFVCGAIGLVATELRSHSHGPASA